MSKKFFIYRNSTVENLFSNINSSYSGYGDISIHPTDFDCYVWCYFLPIKSDFDILSNEICSFYNSIELITKQIPLTKDFFIFTLVPFYLNTIETGNFSLQESINDFNSKIIRLSQLKRNIRIIELQTFLSQYSKVQLVDWKYYYLSGIMLSPKLAVDFHVWFDQQLDAIGMKRKKCLVLDLDNTLWGGVLGEDGVNGIQLGGDYPGNAFLDFQKSILELYKAGVLLAVCSKNNELDVFEAWANNPSMLIREKHLAAYRINWKNKAQNIAEIINQLNIGPESMVYVDDNPAECELVRQFIPEIETAVLPSFPYLLPVFVKDLTDRFFSIYKLIDEDVTKTKQYRENNSRKEFQKEFSNFSDYVASLEIEINILCANEMTIPRISQLTQKTNQFNLTTKRYSEADIYRLIEHGYDFFCISVADRFGNNGITGLLIISSNTDDKSAVIDTFLMSCRILGKDIEFAFLNYILNQLKESGYSTINGTYIRTLKNGQVEDFYDKLGFTCDEITERIDIKIKNYHLNLFDKIFEIKPYYKILKSGN